MGSLCDLHCKQDFLKSPVHILWKVHCLFSNICTNVQEHHIPKITPNVNFMALLNFYFPNPKASKHIRPSARRESSLHHTMNIKFRIRLPCSSSPFCHPDTRVFSLVLPPEITWLIISIAVFPTPVPPIYLLSTHLLPTPRSFHS